MSKPQIHRTSAPNFIGEGKTLKDELIIRSIKMVDIVYIAILYFTFGFITSVIIDKVVGKFDPVEADKKSLFRLYLEIVLHFGVLGIVTYIFRNVIEQIPFPLHGVHGFNHYRMKELTGGAVFSSILILFQTNLHAKLTYTANRLMNKISPQQTSTQVPTMIPMIFRK